MKLKNLLFTLFIILFCFSCSKKEVKLSTIQEKSLDMQVLEAYNEGMSSLKGGDVLFAAKKLNEAETLNPQSIWAPKSALMAAYAYYSQDYYSDSIMELERFLKIYPEHKNLDYAYYLLALCYYEQIIDEKKDLQSISNAKKTFQIIIKNYPQTEYATDSIFKIDLINDVLASKEMYIGRYYLQREKWIAAVNRFRKVVDEYETTMYAEEAIHRLVEVYYIIGLVDEAQKYANLLGYNYQSSEWYKKTYSLFNVDYNKNILSTIDKNKNKNKNKSKIKNFMKSLFD